MRTIEHALPGKKSLRIRAGQELRNCGQLWLILIPGLITLALFKIAPLFGLVIAFENYSSFKGVFGSSWVGFENFRKVLTDPYVWKLAKNTVLLAFWTLVFSFPIPIIFSLFLNEMKFYKAKKAIQSVSFFPYFISVAVVVSIMAGILSPSDGIVNILVQKLGGRPILFMADPKWFRPMYVFVTIWQNFGYNAVVYIAAIAGINADLYEAAEIDGANRWHKMLKITLPCLIPIIITMLIVNLGNILSVDINKVLMMQSPSNYDTSDVLQTYVYRMAFGGEGFPQYSLGTAVSLIQSVLSFLLVMATNWASKKLSDSSAF